MEEIINVYEDLWYRWYTKVLAAVETYREAALLAAARAALDMGNEAIVDTGYTWVTRENIEREEISRMLY